MDTMTREPGRRTPRTVDRTDLFRPGAGGMPFFLAGREHEQGVLARMMGELRRGKAPAHDAAIQGPRGVGKTALLNWAKREGAKPAGRGAGNIRVVLLPAFALKTLPKLFRATLGASVVTGSTRAVETGAGLGLGATRMGGKRVTTETYDGMDEAEWVEALVRSCRDRPSMLLVDEAHTLDPEVGMALLNASQSVRDEAPFMLVLAGTPLLAPHLGRMDSSFWSRLDEGDMPVGLLNRPAARDAIRKPLDTGGVRVDRDALDHMVDDAGCYPYFLQMWGRHALRTLGGHETRLTLAHVQRARPAVQQLRNRYYAERWREIVELRVPQAASALAGACSDGARSIARDAAIDGLTEGLVSDSARMSADDALENLRLLGYVAEGDPDGSIAAGIPSLMAYVRRRAASSVQPRTGGAAAGGKAGIAGMEANRAVKSKPGTPT